MKRLEDFFCALDAAWPEPRAAKLPLRLIGSCAIMLQTDYARGTNDGDVLEMPDMAPSAKTTLIALAGKGTALAKRHGVYIDLVGNGVPLLPPGPKWKALSGLNGSLAVLEIFVLDPVDIAVTKLKRFSTNDRDDLVAMIDRDLVPHPALVERFRSAIDLRADGADEKLSQYVKNLHQTERDVFDVPKTDIELPDWID